MKTLLYCAEHLSYVLPKNSDQTYLAHLIRRCREVAEASARGLAAPRPTGTGGVVGGPRPFDPAARRSPRGSSVAAAACPNHSTGTSAIAGNGESMSPSDSAHTVLHVPLAYRAIGRMAFDVRIATRKSSPEEADVEAFPYTPIPAVTATTDPNDIKPRVTVRPCRFKGMISIRHQIRIQVTALAPGTVTPVRRHERCESYRVVA